MTSRQLDEERIFHVARKIPDEEAQAEYLDQICAGDQALRERVEALLEVHEQEQDFLKSSPEPAPTVNQPPISEAPGHQIGRYKLLQKIGEGGFGIVYMAEQLRPVRRKVALKIIKPGMDTHAVVARFEAERQALALMDHPNISRVLDGGATESGRPYFVMELVKGVAITEYCDANNLSAEERLKLFLTVCQAVQHAHQKGIIHRDIKPSNVLITLADGKPVVKVIDFGVSKALNQQMTEKTLFTAYGQMIGTPQYMSPEQAEMSCLDIDTRSDIYSLSVLLYELLTGTTPLEGERLRTAGYAEMQRIIREEEPPKPSTRLSGSDESRTVIAKHRSATPERLHRMVRGDLDWIVMRALEKDRNRRYESANGLAADIQRSLNDEPVEASPPSHLYALRKFVRRQKHAVGATLAVFVAVLAGAVLSLTLMFWAIQERQEALNAMALVRNEMLDRALEYAIRGDDQKLDLMRTRLETMDVPTEWQSFLEGLADFYAGRIASAQESFEQSIELEEHNPAAQAMSVICSLWEMDQPTTHLRLRELNKTDNRVDYEDYDRTFRAFADLYRWPEIAKDDLEQILDERPFSITARMFYAASMSHTALDTSDMTLATKALEEMAVVQRFAGDTPVVSMFHLFNYWVAIDLLKRQGGESYEIEAQASQFFENADRNASFPLWHTVQAIYLDTIGQDGLGEWKIGAQNGVYVEAYVVQEVAKGDRAEALQLVEDLKHEVTPLCLAYLHASDPERCKKLSDQLAASVDDKMTEFHRMKTIDALLYLGNLPKAIEASKDFQIDPEVGDYLAQERSHAFLCGDQSPNDLLAKCGTSHRKQHRAYWLIAMKHLAMGEHKLAEEAFDACVQQGQINTQKHFAARTIRDRLRADSNWPTWIPAADQ